MENIKWLFFDLGSTLIDETECYKSRIDYIVQNNNIDRAEFVSKVYECAKTSAVAISSAAKCYGFAVHQNICDNSQKPDYIIESIENILDIF